MTPLRLADATRLTPALTGADLRCSATGKQAYADIATASVFAFGTMHAYVCPSCGWAHLSKRAA